MKYLILYLLLSIASMAFILPILSLGSKEDDELERANDGTKADPHPAPGRKPTPRKEAPTKKNLFAITLITILSILAITRLHAAEHAKPVNSSWESKNEQATNHPRRAGYIFYPNPF